MIISAPRLYHTIYAYYNGSAETKGHQSYDEISSKVVPVTLLVRVRALVETLTRSGRVRNIDEYPPGDVFDDTSRSSTPHVTSETITRIGKRRMRVCTT